MHGRLHPQPHELGLKGQRPRPRVVGEERHAPTAPAQEGQHVGSAGHEHLARPHAAIEIEDEAAHLAEAPARRRHARALTPRELLARHVMLVARVSLYRVRTRLLLEPAIDEQPEQAGHQHDHHDPADVLGDGELPADQHP